MIDIVIPTCAKDLETLEIVIKHARKYIKDVNNIYVISKEKYTDAGIFISESLFPFSFQNVYNIVNHETRTGWYYQQLLKFYAYRVIPNISENILILDSETIFYNPVVFIDQDNKALYATSNEKHYPYYIHMKKVLPGLNEVNRHRSGIVHHMLFQRDILDDLFSRVETYSGMPFWKSLLVHVDSNYYNNSGMSEYEIYFCFIFTFYQERVKIRELKWDLSEYILTESDKDFLTAHAHLRK